MHDWKSCEGFIAPPRVRIPSSPLSIENRRSMIDFFSCQYRSSIRRGARAGLSGRSRKPLWPLVTVGSNPSLSAFNCLGAVAQFGRASRSQCEGRGFDPHRLHQGCARWGVSGALFPAIRYSRVEFPSEAFSAMIVTAAGDVDSPSPSQ